MIPPIKGMPNKLKRNVKSQIDEYSKIQNNLTQEDTKLKCAREELNNFFYRLVVLNEIAQILASGLEFKNIFYAIIQALKNLFDFDIASMSLLNEANELATVFTLKTVANSNELVQEVQVPLSQIENTIIESQRGLILNDLTENKDTIPRILIQEIILSSIIVPLISRNKVLGLFNIGNNKISAYNEENLFVLQCIADQIAPGIERTLLYIALKEGEERFKAQFKGIPIPSYTFKRVGKDFILVEYNDAAKAINKGKIVNFKGKTAREIYTYNPEILEDLLSCFNKKVTIGRELQSRLYSEDQNKFLAIKYIFLPPNLVTVHIEDITERKRVEEEMKERLMKFKLENGNIYLIKEPTLALSLEVFKDLLKIGYHGFAISRMPKEEFNKLLNENYEFFWLAEKNEKNILSPELKKIEAQIEKIPNKSAILIDRLDYIIFKNGFKETVSFIQHLREYAYLSALIIILSIDPSTLKEGELILLEKETKEVESRFIIDIPETMFEILRYIYQQNNFGVKPSYTEIQSKMKISKPTARKRIRGLLCFGYISEFVMGNKKNLELTRKGWNLFLKQIS